MAGHKAKDDSFAEPRIELSLAAEAPVGHLEGWTLEGLDYPTFRLSLVAKVMDRMTLRFFARLSDLSICEWRVLCRLCGNGEMTVGQIAEQAWVDRAEVSRSAAALVARGWVGRRANPQDGRMPILFATDAGRAAFKPLLDIRSQFHKDMLADLSPLEQQLLDALLNKLAARLLQISSRADG